ncbi:MAG: peptidyl-prolyl cis-trans isomerase [Acidobacteriaceae bacterium]
MTLRDLAFASSVLRTSILRVSIPRPLQLRSLLLAGSVLIASPLVAVPLIAQQATTTQQPAAPTQQPSAQPAAPQQPTKAQQQAAAQQKFEPTAQASPFGGTVVEDIVARVNEQIITRSDYDRAMQQLEQDGKQQGWSAQDLANRKHDLLRDLVDQQLLLSKGKELGITGDTELVRRLDEIRKQNHLESMDDLEKAATQQGVSYEDFKQNIRNGIITQQVIRDEVGRHIQLSSAELQRFYQQHKDEFAQPESVRLSEILIPVGTGTDQAADLAAAQAKADGIAAKLKAGSSFEELAKADSTGSTAAQGGDLGEFRRGMLAKELEDKTFALQPGQITEPIRTKQGYVILKVTQHTPGGAPDLNAVRPQVEEAAFMSRMQPQLRLYLTQLRQQAYIDYRPGYVDSAATSDSVKPLYSAYIPPAPKKKAKLQRTRYRATGHTYRNKSKAGATATAAGATTQVATTAPTATQKPGKKEKVRYGQAPREALPAAATPTVQTAEGAQTGIATGAGAAGTGAAGSDGQVARNVAPDISTNADVPTQAAPVAKTRFADRARIPKPKKVKSADQAETENVEKISTDEVEAQKTQSAPLGLAGDTLHPKKAKTKGEKTRYADNAGKKPEAPAPPPSSTPSPLATPGSAPPANPGTAPQESAPAATPDTAPAGQPQQSAPPATQPAPTQQQP